MIDVSVTFGISHAALLRMRQKPAFPDGDPIYSEFSVQNMHTLNLSELNGEIWKQELYPGQGLEALLKKLVPLIDMSLQSETQSKYSIEQHLSRSTGHPVSLLKWTEEVMMDAGTIGLFGTKILDLDPKLVQKFLTFDDENWKLWYKWPNASAMHAAKTTMIKTIEDYLSLPQEERSDAAHIVDLIQKTTNALGLSKKDIAASLAMLYWVSVTSTFEKSILMLSSRLTNSPQIQYKYLQSLLLGAFPYYVRHFALWSYPKRVWISLLWWQAWPRGAVSMPPPRCARCRDSSVLQRILLHSNSGPTHDPRR